MRIHRITNEQLDVKVQAMKYCDQNVYNYNYNYNNTEY